jgi:hypothetical protein
MNAQGVSGVTTADVPEILAEQPGTTAPVSVSDEAGAVVPQAALTALFDQNGNYVGSYGIDPSTGTFSAWNSQGQETSFQAFAAEHQLANGATPVASDGGNAVLYNSSGQIIGLDVAGYVVDTPNVAQNTPTPIDGDTTVYDEMGTTELGSFGYSDAKSDLLLDGNSADATLESEGFTASQIGQVEHDLQANGGWILSSATDAAIYTALVQNEIDQNINAAGTVPVGVYNAQGDYMGAFAGQTTTFVAYNQDGSSNVTPVLQDDGVTADNEAAAYQAFTVGPVTSGDYTNLRQINVAMSAYLLSQATPSSIGNAVDLTDEGQGTLEGLIGIDSATGQFALEEPSSNNDVIVDLNSALETEGFSASTLANDASLEESSSPLSQANFAALQTLAVALDTAANFVTDISQLSTQQIQALTGTQIASLSATQIDGLSQEQIAALTSTQIASLTSGELQQLSQWQWDGFTAAQLKELSIAQLSGASLPGISPTALNQLSESQIASLQSIPNLGSGVSELSVTTLQNLTSAQFSQLFATGADTAEWLTATQVSSFTGPMVSELGSAVSEFGPSQVAALSSAGLAALSGPQISSLSDVGLIGLTSSQIASLTTAQLAGFGGNSFGNLSAQQVADFSTAQLAALSPAAISSLNWINVQGLTPANIAALSAAQVAAITPYTLSRLSSSQLASLTPSQISALSTSQVAGLGDLQISSLSDAQVGALSAAQVGALSPTQIAQFTAAQFPSLTSAAIGGLTMAQLNYVWLPWLSTAQVAGLSTSTIAGMSTSEITRLSNAQLGALTAKQISAITDLQYAELSSAQQAALSAADYDDTFTSIANFTALGENNAGASTTYNADGSVSISVESANLAGSALYNAAGALVSETLAYADGNVVTLTNSNGYSEADEVFASGQQISQINTVSGVYAATAEESEAQTGGDAQSVFETTVNTTSGPLTIATSWASGSSIGVVSALLEGDDDGAPVAASSVASSATPPPLPPPTASLPDPPPSGLVCQSGDGQGALAGFGVSIVAGLAGAMVAGPVGAALGFGAGVVGLFSDSSSDVVCGWDVYDGQSIIFVPDGPMTVDYADGESDWVDGSEQQNADGTVTITLTVVEDEAPLNPTPIVEPGPGPDGSSDTDGSGDTDGTGDSDGTGDTGGTSDDYTLTMVISATGTDDGSSISTSTTGTTNAANPGGKPL